MWKPEHRRAADRRGLRYPSDLSDAEWDLVAPLIPPAKRGGRPRKVDVREVLNAIFCVLSTGCTKPGCSLKRRDATASMRGNYLILKQPQRGIRLPPTT